ncbi:peptidase M18 [Neohortaea acidophila]|uniref:aspartyl aminopeptidase n=1 Tax=Neohortaea acidophila TaxID=245834 RepID=A0A6A6Q1D2_9PEZI|nr:peptidase M18 [Neohortaea acidophila]KAF2485796.1 peptidase M18 [Neohortaea acidophila]
MIALRSCLTFRIFPESRFIASSPTIYTSLRFRHSRTMASKASLKRAEDFVDFLNASPSAFHAVHSAKLRLEKAGFTQIKERDAWSSTLQPGGKYYLTRNASTIIAFAIGAAWKPGNPIAMVGAHTDSPCLRVKPISKHTGDGYMQVGVECYGGGMWHTWFDRDLSLAGRVMVKGADGAMEHRLVRVNKPILRIPNLAVHFGSSVPFEFNKETQLYPIAGLVSAELNRTGKTAEETKKAEGEAEKDADFAPLKATSQRHHPYLISLISKEAGCKPEEVLDFELLLYDTQPSRIGGLNDEFVYSARLDNLGMTYCTVEGLIQSLRAPVGGDDSIIRLIACFDHEEIGSTSAQGADSNILPAVIRRLSCLPAASSSSASESSEGSYEKVHGHSGADDLSTAFEQTLATSFLISADMAHAVNPNYSAKHEPQHRPEMNAGTVIKVNANVRYATSSPGIVLLQECARRAKAASFQPPGAKTSAGGVPLQLLVMRNDSPCGSTIGPMMSAKLGVRTIDVGNPQLAMHSIRETCGTHDVEHGVNLFESFFEHYGELEKKVLVD